MTRTLAILILIVIAVLLAVVWSAQHRINGLAMPLLVESSAPVPDPPPVMLFAPCPIAPRNFPRMQERKA